MTILPSRIQRYLIIGVGVYIFELLVIAVAQLLGASGVMAVSVSFWLGLLLSFVLQKLVTFGDKRSHHRILLSQIAAFSLLVAFNFGFTLLVTKLLGEVIPVVLCRTLALLITTAWNFYLYRTRIFITHAQPPVNAEASK